MFKQFSCNRGNSKIEKLQNIGPQYTVMCIEFNKYVQSSGKILMLSWIEENSPKTVQTITIKRNALKPMTFSGYRSSTTQWQ